MAIPKVIYQTYSTSKLPLFVRYQIWKLKRKHKDYKYEFYDDQMINDFIRSNFQEKTYNLYKKLQIRSAKADFFRYAILYIKGGIYLDIDS